jgi:hypothetical protein
MLGEPSSDNETHVNRDIVTSENSNERNISESGVDNMIERNDESMSRDKAVELVKDKNCVQQTDKKEHDTTKFSEPLCSKIPTKLTLSLDATSSGELTDKGNGGACQRTGFIEASGLVANNGSNVVPCFDSESMAALSTPMLNIVDYLPPEIMHSLQGNLPNSNTNGSTSSDSMGNVFPTSDMDASMDCLYCPPSCELSLQNHVLSDCVTENVSNCSFELHHADSYSCGILTAAETERVKDMVSFISSWNNTSPHLLHNLAVSNIHENENIILGCSSEDSEDFVNSIFKDVSLSVSGQEENKCKGSTEGTKSDVLVSPTTHDVLAPEVILEPRTSNACQAADPGSRPVAVEPDTKKSKKPEVHQRKKGERYLPQFKVKVLAYAASHTLKETARKFKVNDGTVSSWKKEKGWKKQMIQVCSVTLLLMSVVK